MADTEPQPDPTVREMQQEIVDSVAAERSGDDEAIVREALLQAFVVRGLTPPPDTWLTNVATSVSEGRGYVVGPHGHVFGEQASGPRMSEQESPLTTGPPPPPAYGA